MDLAGGLATGILLLAAGSFIVWKLHAVGSLLAIGIVLLAVGLCGVVAALMGAGLGVILGGAGTVVVLLGLFWILGQAGG
jgi:hypothetical protein